MRSSFRLGGNDVSGSLSSKNCWLSSPTVSSPIGCLVIPSFRVDPNDGLCGVNGGRLLPNDGRSVGSDLGRVTGESTSLRGLRRTGPRVGRLGRLNDVGRPPKGGRLV